MNARGFRSMTVTMLLLAMSVVIMAAASASRIQAMANRHLTIAIVDTQRTSVARNEFRAEIANLLKNVVAEICGSDVMVRPVFVGGRDAKLKLNGGDYDAALVIGEDRPLALRRMDLVTLAGAMPAPNGLQPVSLILGKNDAAINEQLRVAFSRLLGARVAPYVGASAPGAKLATIGG